VKPPLSFYRLDLLVGIGIRITMPARISLHERGPSERAGLREPKYLRFLVVLAIDFRPWHLFHKEQGERFGGHNLSFC